MTRRVSSLLRNLPQLSKRLVSSGLGPTWCNLWKERQLKRLSACLLPLLLLSKQCQFSCNCELQLLLCCTQQHNLTVIYNHTDGTGSCSSKISNPAVQKFQTGINDAWRHHAITAAASNSRRVSECHWLTAECSEWQTIRLASHMFNTHQGHCKQPSATWSPTSCSSQLNSVSYP